MAEPLALPLTAPLEISTPLVARVTRMSERLADLLAARVAAHLRERLDRPEATSEELLDFVCRRRGEIAFDPGWVELRLPVDEISVELRRAGLDLDPGWVPWLGCVVRFVYG